MSAIDKIVLASGNAGKLRELDKVLSPLGVVLRPQSEFQVPDVEETGLTFVENAILKARAASQHSRLPAIADDSGLEVDALNGAPGIYSARYAGAGASDQANLEKLLADLDTFYRPSTTWTPRSTPSPWMTAPFASFGMIRSTRRNFSGSSSTGPEMISGVRASSIRIESTSSTTAK